MISFIAISTISSLIGIIALDITIDKKFYPDAKGLGDFFAAKTAEELQAALSAPSLPTLNEKIHLIVGFLMGREVERLEP